MAGQMELAAKEGQMGCEEVAKSGVESEEGSIAVVELGQVVSSICRRQEGLGCSRSLPGGSTQLCLLVREPGRCTGFGAKLHQHIGCSNIPS